MKLNYKRTFFIGLAFLSICAFWQVYDNVIPLILQNTFHLKETATGVIMALDNILAIFLLPVFGTLSDKVDTPLGRRTPFIICGTLFAVAFYLLLIVADRKVNLLLFVVMLFGALLSMGLYRSPAVALMPDLTPNVVRSKANAVINLMGSIGGVYALIMIKLLSGKKDAAGKTDYFPLFLSISVLMIAAVVILVFTINEKKVKNQVEGEIRRYAKLHPEDSKELQSLDGGSALKAVKGATPEELSRKAAESMPKDGPTSTVVVNPPMTEKVKRSMIFLLVSIFFWFTAYNAVTTAFSRYVGHVWGMKDGSYATCLLVATVAAVISYIPIGLLSSRIGRKKMILIGVALMALCYLLAGFVNQYAFWINGVFALIGFAWASINVNSYPMVVEMSKGSDIGKFTGTYYTFSMAAQIMTPILSGFLLEHVSYRTLFPYAFGFSVAAFLTMTQVRHGDVRPAAKASVLEHFDVDD